MTISCPGSCADLGMKLLYLFFVPFCEKNTLQNQHSFMRAFKRIVTVEGKLVCWLVVALKAVC